MLIYYDPIPPRPSELLTYVDKNSSWFSRYTKKYAELLRNDIVLWEGKSASVVSVVRYENYLVVSNDRHTMHVCNVSDAHDFKVYDLAQILRYRSLIKSMYKFVEDHRDKIHDLLYKPPHGLMARKTCRDLTDYTQR